VRAKFVLGIFGVTALSFGLGVSADDLVIDAIAGESPGHAPISLRMTRYSTTRLFTDHIYM
jgi:hypothetical protein